MMLTFVTKLIKSDRRYYCELSGLRVLRVKEGQRTDAELLGKVMASP